MSAAARLRRYAEDPALPAGTRALADRAVRELDSGRVHGRPAALLAGLGPDATDGQVAEVLDRYAAETAAALPDSVDDVVRLAGRVRR